MPPHIRSHVNIPYPILRMLDEALAQKHQQHVVIHVILCGLQAADCSSTKLCSSCKLDKGFGC
eukprot:scaffold2363_cov159-Amphora_coffeaeformis.AAC.2